jgi:hypothetical protein
MKITEIIQPKTSSATSNDKVIDVVPQDIVPETIDGTIVEHADHSAIAEGVSQILRRVKGKGLQSGFRCTSGPRKGRIVSKPSTCFAQRQVAKGAKIAKKRQIKAKQTAAKTRIQKRSGAGSRRLKKAQIKTGTKLDRPTKKLSSKVSSKRGPIKSKIVKPRK